MPTKSEAYIALRSKWRACERLQDWSTQPIVHRARHPRYTGGFLQVQNTGARRSFVAGRYNNADLPVPASASRRGSPSPIAPAITAVVHAAAIFCLASNRWHSFLLYWLRQKDPLAHHVALDPQIPRYLRLGYPSSASPIRLNGNCPETARSSSCLFEKPDISLEPPSIAWH